MAPWDVLQPPVATKPGEPKFLAYEADLPPPWPAPTLGAVAGDHSGSPMAAPEALTASVPDDRYGAGLVEERPDAPAFPKIQLGKVAWIKSDPHSNVTGPMDDPVLVARIAIDTEGLTAEISVCCRAQGDSSLSRLQLDVRFVSRAARDPVRALTGIQMRQTGNVRGDPLAAKIEASGSGEFRVDLSQTRADLDHNLRLLLGRPWIDLALDFASGRKATMAFASANIGADIIEQALHPQSSPE